jgi:hypothetical protein
LIRLAARSRREITTSISYRVPGNGAAGSQIAAQESYKFHRLRDFLRSLWLISKTSLKASPHEIFRETEEEFLGFALDFHPQPAQLN